MTQYYAVVAVFHKCDSNVRQFSARRYPLPLQHGSICNICEQARFLLLLIIRTPGPANIDRDLGGFCYCFLIDEPITIFVFTIFTTNRHT